VQQITESAVPPPEPSVYALALKPEGLSTPAPPPPVRAKRGRAGGCAARSRFSIFQESQLQAIAGGLLALSAADLFMTFTLLRTSAAFFESNPVAQWFFAQWNVAGLVGFKFSVIAAVIVISEFIERRRPGWGRFVLLIGCVGAAYAVYQGFTLYVAPPVATAGGSE
jgi:hypothetical protein